MHVVIAKPQRTLPSGPGPRPRVRPEDMFFARHPLIAGSMMCKKADATRLAGLLSVAAVLRHTPSSGYVASGLFARARYQGFIANANGVYLAPVSRLNPETAWLERGAVNRPVPARPWHYSEGYSSSRSGRA
ncbi:hypothetical protein MES5069_620111 [Mesorhizobium escarrei]|uniref:Uncharacterized protein n=1 Tax=Mesorhizobium escarrei TaxID=666018 RepID=A0ABN8KE43_9HYPH|nr:hypothetical protein MES5069_620111 [Mesorhizobium escarrei]